MFTTAIIGVGAAKDTGFWKGGGHRIGYTHAQSYKRSPRCRLAAGVDINPENLAAFQKTFDVPHGFADVGEMLEKVRPDIVSIGTYVGLHRSFIERCARAGVKAIFCEKPFLAAPADVEPVRSLVQETGVKISVAHIRRYRPAFVRAAELVRVGAIGTPQLFYSSLGGWDLSEMGAHWVDLFRMFNGDRPVKWVLGQARVRDQKGYGHRMEDAALAYFAFDNGVRASLEAGEGMNGDANHGIVLTGTAGTLRIRGESVVTLETLTGSKVEDFTAHPPAGWDRLGVRGESSDWNNLWDCTLADLLAWVDGAAEPRTGFTNALATLEVNHAAYASALLGDRIDLPITGKALDITRYPVDEIHHARSSAVPPIH